MIKLVNSLIAQAVEEGASDIHFEPDGRDMRVRFRVDGVLSETTTIPRRMVAGVVSRVKIMADLDIAEKRVPQDGRVGLNVEGHTVDIRVVTMPSVLRRGRRDAHPRQERRADGPRHARAWRATGATASSAAFHQAYGAVLVTGPTGSGKSTTLYAALNAINSIDKNIITIEDPVEYQLAGVNQLQVNLKAGLTFAARSALDAARRPRRDHGRRDPRRGDRADRGRVRAHRPPRALDAAHQRRAVGDHPPHRDGHRAVPHRLGGGLRGGPAARAEAVHALQEAGDPERADARGRGLPRGLRRGGLRAGRLSPLRRQSATRAASASTR